MIKKFNSAIFPGLQGGPLMHVIAAKAVCFKEALSNDFKEYTKNVVNNAKVLSNTLKEKGFKIFSGGTDTHLMLIDLRSFGVTGKDAQASLGRANITCNKNGIPFDSESPMITSGIRLGTPACTTRGFGAEEFKLVGELIFKVIDGLSKNKEDNSKIEKEVQKEIIELCSSFPIYIVKIFMLCPFCREKDTSVVDSRPTEDGTAIRRRRLCGWERKERFTTFERVQFQELTVIKGNGSREPFDRDKISKSIRIATRKRPIDSETIEKYQK